MSLVHWKPWLESQGFNWGEQHDVHEALIRILSTMGTPEWQDASKFEEENSYFGMPACNCSAHFGRTAHPFRQTTSESTSLIIPLKENCTLVDAVDDFLQPEMIEWQDSDSNTPRPTCSKCNAPYSVHKVTALRRMPKILFFWRNAISRCATRMEGQSGFTN